MSASSLPVNRASPFQLGHPVLKHSELRHVAELLAGLDHMLSLAVNPRASAELSRQVLTAAHQQAAYLAAYTQPWAEQQG
jgi:hypothetical protein